MCILLAAVMTASLLVACGNNSTNTDSSNEQKPEQTIQQAEPESVEAEVLIPEGKKLTYWSTWTGSKMVTSPGDTEYFKAIQKATGIPLEFVSSTGGKDQLAVLIASGEIPDIIHEWTGNYPGTIMKALSDGIIIPLNDLIDKGYAPNFKAYLNKDTEVDKLSKTDEGIYYSFPMIRLPDSPLVWNGYMIREDWLKELGLEMPKTLKDMENILLEFKEKKGASSGFAGAWNNYSRVVNAFDTEEGFYIGEDGKVRYGFMDQQYKDFLVLFSEWMKKGIVDPDIFTQDIDTFYSKIATGKYGLIWGNNGGEFNKIEAIKKENPGMNYIPVPNLTRDESAKFNYNISSYRVNTIGVSISSGCEYPEAAAKVCDYVYGEEGHMLSNFGQDGVTYTMVDGYPKFTEYVTNNTDGYSQREVWEHYAGSNNKSFLVDARMMEQDYKLPQQKEAIKLWSTPDAKLRGLPPLTFTSEESQEYASIINEIDSYTKEMKMKFILGVEPVSNFDSFVENLKSMNIEKAIQIQQAALDRFNKR